MRIDDDTRGTAAPARAIVPAGENPQNSQAFPYRLASDVPFHVDVTTRDAVVAIRQQEYQDRLFDSGRFRNLLSQPTGRKESKRRKADYRINVLLAQLHCVDPDEAFATGRLVSFPTVRELSRLTGLGRSSIYANRLRLIQDGFLKLLEKGGWAKGQDGYDASVYELIEPAFTARKTGKQAGQAGVGPFRRTGPIGSSGGGSVQTDGERAPGPMGSARQDRWGARARTDPSVVVAVVPQTTTADPPPEPVDRIDLASRLRKLGIASDKAELWAAKAQTTAELVARIEREVADKVARGNVQKSRGALAVGYLQHPDWLPPLVKSPEYRGMAEADQEQRAAAALERQAIAAEERRIRVFIADLSDAQMLERRALVIAGQPEDSPLARLLRRLSTAELRSGKYPNLCALIAAAGSAGVS